MPIRLGIIATLSTALTLLAVSAHPIDESQFSPADIIVRDVAIVGGGAAGSHAAVRLSQDFHKSVVLVDKAAQLVCTPMMFFLHY
jgi:ribulose 1,5-bisphosphate synthetase/thiazole synthase